LRAVTEFHRTDLLAKSRLCWPNLRKTGDLRRPPFIVGDKAQRASQAVGVKLPVLDGAILIIPQELKRSDFFTAIQTSHSVIGSNTAGT